MQNCASGITTLDFSFSKMYSSHLTYQIFSCRLDSATAIFQHATFRIRLHQHPTAIQERITSWVHITLATSPAVECEFFGLLTNYTRGSYLLFGISISLQLRCNSLFDLLSSPTNENLCVPFFLSKTFLFIIGTSQ